MRRAKREGVVRKERNWVWRSGEAVMPDCMVVVVCDCIR